MINKLLIFTSYIIPVLVLISIYFSITNSSTLLYHLTSKILHIKLINNGNSLFDLNLILYTCTCTYFNIFFYYKFIHSFLYHLTSTISHIKLINNGNSLFDLNLIHYTCTYTCFNIFCYYKFIHSLLYQST